MTCTPSRSCRTRRRCSPRFPSPIRASGSSASCSPATSHRPPIHRRDARSIRGAIIPRRTRRARVSRRHSRPRRTATSSHASSSSRLASAGKNSRPPVQRRRPSATFRWRSRRAADPDPNRRGHPVTSPVNAGATTLDQPPTLDRRFFGHPRGLATLFFTEMWERFSYYGLRPLLVLFMTAALASGGFGFERTQASSIVGIYAASVYLASLPGGWVADRLLGLRRAIFCGAVLISCGHMSIGFSAFAASRVPFFMGLVLIVLGTGLLKPNISAIVGDLYPEGGARRDAGFSIFYMGINLGAFLGQIVTGVLGEWYGWHWGFGAAGVGMLLGLMWFSFFARRTLGNIGMEPTRHPDPVIDAKQKSTAKLALFAGLGVLVLVIALAASGIITINPAVVGSYMLYVLVGLAVAFFAFIFAAGGLTIEEKKRCAVIFVLFIFAAAFWGAFEQAPTSLNLFASDFTDRNIFGFEVPVL